MIIVELYISRRRRRRADPVSPSGVALSARPDRHQGHARVQEATMRCAMLSRIPARRCQKSSRPSPISSTTRSVSGLSHGSIQGDIPENLHEIEKLEERGPRHTMGEIIRLGGMMEKEWK